MAIAEQLADALRTAGLPARVEARQALDAALDPRAGGFCIGVSHEGATRATVLALEEARGSRGGDGQHRRAARIAARARSRITSSRRRSSTARGATPWHMRAPLSPAQQSRRAITRSEVDGRLRHPGDAGVVREQIDALAAKIHGTSRILTVGLGADLVTARELALKIEEGARMPSTALRLESLLHGHLAGAMRPDSARPLRRRLASAALAATGA